MNQCNTSSTNESSILTTTSCQCDTAATDSTTMAATDVSTGTDQNCEENSSIYTCTIVGGALGALSGVLALVLGAVVLGWFVSCHRTKIKNNKTANADIR